MSVKYNIELSDNISADFWKVLTKNFNVILIKMQHYIDGKILCIELQILET